MVGETYSGVGVGVVTVVPFLLLGLVVWAVVDVAQRSPEVLPRKTGWLVGIVAGTLLLGPVGLIVAIVYLVAVRPRLNRA